MTRSAASKQRRVADTQAWRARQKRGAVVLPVEANGELFDLLERFGGVKFEVQQRPRTPPARRPCQNERTLSLPERPIGRGLYVRLRSHHHRLGGYWRPATPLGSPLARGSRRRKMTGATALTRLTE